VQASAAVHGDDGNHGPKDPEPIRE
jgi:hypothetical protein